MWTGASCLLLAGGCWVENQRGFAVLNKQIGVPMVLWYPQRVGPCYAFRGGCRSVCGLLLVHFSSLWVPLQAQALNSTQRSQAHKLTPRHTLGAPRMHNARRSRTNLHRTKLAPISGYLCCWGSVILLEDHNSRRSCFSTGGAIRPNISHYLLSLHLVQKSP